MATAEIPDMKKTVQCIWDDIADLPQAEFERLLRSPTRPGRRIRFVVLNTVKTAAEGGKPLSAAELNAQFDAPR